MAFLNDSKHISCTACCLISEGRDAAKAAQDGSDASRSAASTLREIKGLLDAAIRAQTQDALKATTGANMRGLKTL
jgi:hypothetical protein